MVNSGSVQSGQLHEDARRATNLRYLFQLTHNPFARQRPVDVDDRTLAIEIVDDRPRAELPPICRDIADKGHAPATMLLLERPQSLRLA